jgi:hypothetical protein
MSKVSAMSLPVLAPWRTSTLGAGGGDGVEGDGVAVGRGVGAAVGVGRGVGRGVGAAVGVGRGVGVGLAVGRGVGATVGDRLAVGLAAGVGLGSPDGAIEGHGDGVQPDEAEGVGVGPVLGHGVAVEDADGPEPHAPSMDSTRAAVARRRAWRPERHCEHVPKRWITGSRPWESWCPPIRPAR